MLSAIKFYGLVFLISLGVSFGINSILPSPAMTIAATSCPCGICKDGKVCDKPCSCAAPKPCRDIRDLEMTDKCRTAAKKLVEDRPMNPFPGMGESLSFGCCHCHER